MQHAEVPSTVLPLHLLLWISRIARRHCHPLDCLHEVTSTLRPQFSSNPRLAGAPFEHPFLACHLVFSTTIFLCISNNTLLSADLTALVITIGCPNATGAGEEECNGSDRDEWQTASTAARLRGQMATGRGDGVQRILFICFRPVSFGIGVYPCVALFFLMYIT
jgi:hypothetical protein